MATNQEWHYAKDGTEHGPVSSSDLEALAASGELSPSDLIWKEGMADWKLAGKFKGLFPENDASNDGDRKPSPPTSNTDATPAEPARKRSILASAKSAAQFATNKAERKKLTSLTLPSLYQALGRHCFTSYEFREEFTEPFQKLDQIQKSLSEIASRAQPIAKTLGDKAKAMGGQAMQAVESKKLSLRQSSLFGSLGQVVYEKHGEKSGPQSLVKPIHDTLARISTLDEELKTLSTAGSDLGASAKQTARGIVSVFLSLLMWFPIRLILVWKTWPTYSKLKWTGGFCLVVLLLVFVSHRVQSKAKANFDSANQLWSAGDKDMAIQKYKRAISYYSGFIPKGERSIVFERVIEHEVEKGNHASANELIQRALEEKVPLMLEHPQAKQLMAAVQGERIRLQEDKAAKERQRVRDEAAAKERQAALATQTAKTDQGNGKPTQDEARTTDSSPPSEKVNAIIAVAGAEPDRKKWEAASARDPRRWSDRKVSYRVQEFKNIISILKESPDRLASEKQTSAFNEKLEKHIGFFMDTPFNGSYQHEDAKELIDLWEKQVENKYKGHFYLLLKDEMACIFQQYKNRVE